VVLLVLIVPELLSGPERRPAAPARSTAGSTDAVRNVTVDLATKKATPEEESAAASVAVSPSSAVRSAVPTAPPEEAQVPGSEARSATPPTITTLKAQQAEPPPVENQAPPSKSSPVGARSGATRDTRPAETMRHGWAVQLGSFSSRANAERLMRQLKAHDSAYVAPTGKGPTLRYRVRVGPLADRGAAEKMVVKLKKEGHSASVVAP